jgi:hypothetical protein
MMILDPFWHWIFVFSAGALAGWSLAALRAGDERSERGHFLRFAGSLALAALFVYGAWQTGTGYALLSAGLAVGAAGLLFILGSWGMPRRRHVNK